jgi:hypothetical protein
MRTGHSNRERRYEIRSGSRESMGTIAGLVLAGSVGAPRALGDVPGDYCEHTE